jgi:hypothetical protein
MVATAAQIAANRANARRSTGPRTPEGKAASSRNALTHGAYAADDTILATAPDTYLADFRAHFQPVGILEEHLVEHLAVLASRRERLQLAMDALLELNERHALIEHLHERYGVNIPAGIAIGQPSWQGAMRRYDGHEGPDPRRPELVSDPALDPDPILCSLVYTLSGPRAAALFRHEASVDRRFHTALKELTTLQARRRDAAAAAASTPPAVPLFEPRLQRALDHHLRQTAAPVNPRRDPLAPATPGAPDPSPAAPTPDRLPARVEPAAGPVTGVVATGRALFTDQSQSADPSPQSCPAPDQHEPGVASAQKEPNVPSATPDDPGAPSPLQPDRRIEPGAGATPRSFAAALAAKLRECGIEPAAAAYLAGDDTAFRGVLPRDPNQPSSVLAQRLPARLPGQ